MSTITRTNNGAGPMTHEEKESMHFNTPLTFSRKAVKIYQQTGRKETKNLIPGTTWPQWTIETTTPPTSNNETSGFRCSLIQQIGFTPAELPQPTSRPGETPPPGNTSLENVKFMRRSTIAEATRQLGKKSAKE